jgi:hypothetical protein
MSAQTRSVRTELNVFGEIERSEQTKTLVSLSVKSGSSCNFICADLSVQTNLNVSGAIDKISVFRVLQRIHRHVQRVRGVMVSVLVIRPRVRAFTPGQGDGLLIAIKIRSTPSFGEEVKQEAPCRNILRHIKITCKYERKYFARLNS